MKPYYEDDAVTLYHGDALDVLAEIPDSSVSLIVTDPPFYRVKDEPWDRAWDKPAAFLSWIGALCEQWQRVLTPNGSLYVFASTAMSARVEVEIRRWFNVLNAIRWAKNDGTANEGGMHSRTHKEDLRAYFPASESIIFAEHFGADNMAKGEAGYVTKCDELRGFVFEPLRAYLDGERRAAGVNFDDVRAAVGCADGSGLPSHWFTKSQWILPTADNYAKLRGLFNRKGDEYLRTEYEELRTEYEELRTEYEELRRPFALTPQDAYTDVWTFPTVQSYRGKHPCEKPPHMAQHVVKASSREGDTVLDCFCGSGVFLAEAVAMGRKVIGCDALDRWCSVTRDRCRKAARGEAWIMGGARCDEALPGQEVLFP